MPRHVTWGVLVMLQFQFVSGFGTATGSWSMLSVLLPFSTPAGDWLVAGSSATGTLHLLSLGAGTATLISSQSLPDPSGTYMLTDAAPVTLGGQMQLYSASRTGGWIDVQHIAPLAGGFDALPPIVQVGGVTMSVSVVEPLELNSGTFLATAAHDRGTLEILRLSADGPPRLVERVTDGPKAVLDGVSDLVSLTRGSELFLIAASGRRDGLSSFRVGADGRLELADSLTVSTAE